ncbi:peptidyl-tRNA hydrolase [Kribbella flavida DSM 17836]|uniref:Peptidyl-tRNA hydrolase n=1 Tax=Kribbella flavida (strain DSM 17836 / JCM 10339 / NBRC 14399) TaxID=479435 RepID=D2PPB1_KRIFD|nr:aminoacyl-tRNA hydrolase [Kribbella flavida]ADB34707.1 peptidyl-tRNA hydrolase [Kribbella flavida DSM 17836]
MADDVWLVVGLGNPGPTYAKTRHNVGQSVADELAGRVGGGWKQHKQARAEVIETRIGGARTVLAKPRSYMNESGGPVAGLLRFFKVEPAQLIAVHDELDLDFATLRVKFGGGDNGHNGLRSIRKSVGTGDYHRVRFGVGRPPGRQNPADFVLNEFSAAERKDLPFALDRTADAVESLIADGLEVTQGKYNS